jgi:splicing factor U2AF subunit
MKLSNPILNIETIFIENGQYYIFDLATKDDIEILKAMNNTEWRAYRMRIEKPASFFREFNATQGRNVELKVIKKQGFLTESDNKLYMGGIPTSAKENEIREIVESFGQLKSFNLVKDPNSEEEMNRGFCFFEYVDEKVTDRAVKGLHNREMGEKRLKVQRANINCKSFTIAQQIKNTPVDMTPREQGKSNFSDAIITEENIIQLDIPIYSSIPSRVVQLINLVTTEDIMDDADYREIIEDIRNECNQFGTVLNVEIPRPDKTTSLASNAVGKIFVKFSTLPSAKKARYNLSGRKFNRKTVIASFYPENYFDVREFNYH